MNKVKEDLLLHPVRLRIILAIFGREVTAQQLIDELPDISQASLYRNLNMLAAAGILSVVRERRVRNTFEKTYALPLQGLSLTVEDLKNAQPEDYVRLFTQYLGQLLGYFARYIEHGSRDPLRDNILFQMFPLYLSDAEIMSLGHAITKDLHPYLKNVPSSDRRRYIIGLVSLLDVAGATRPAVSQTGATSGRPTDSGKE
jgi:DNA-binding transcriptional ArsR family regulator